MSEAIKADQGEYFGSQWIISKTIPRMWHFCKYRENNNCHELQQCTIKVQPHYENWRVLKMNANSQHVDHNSFLAKFPNS